MNLINTYINEYSGINIHQQCGDDPDHNAKAKKGKALLSLIEAKAIEYKQTEILNDFIKAQQLGIGGWSEKCNSK